MIKSIDSKVYRLIQPGQIKEVHVQRELKEGWVAVEPSIVSVCHADLRYYTGQRRPEALAKKLPMALFHEGIGTVVESASEKFKVGQRVVIAPNIPGHALHGVSKDQCCEPCRKGTADNYCEDGVFLGSGYDGIAQSRLVHPDSCLVVVPDELPDEIAVLAELCTVSYHSISHIREVLNRPDTRIALFGDGPVGYLTAAMIHHIYGIDADRFTVFGADEQKLGEFDFATREMVQKYDFSKGPHYDVVLECTGGKFSESAINQGIDIIARGGHLVLMGVSEQLVPINTRDILEKGLTLYGSSRSSTKDFEEVIAAMQNKAYQQSLRKVINSESVLVSSAEELKKAMDDVAAKRGWKKTILQYKW